jgi:hypothetical protein
MNIKIADILDFMDKKYLIDSDKAKDLRIQISDNYNNKWEIEIGNDKGDFIGIRSIGNNNTLIINPIASNYIYIYITII